MKNKSFKNLNSKIVIPLLSIWIFICACNSSPPPNLNTLFSKDSITILITDSGLGGLSICANLEQNIKSNKCFNNVNIIFFNALIDLNRKYNQIHDEYEKISTFEKAIAIMLIKFNPDVILIACNTLSVLYPKTKYYNKLNIPVVEIVSIGVNEIINKLKQLNSSNVLVCGTETTIKSDVHRILLMKKGIDSTRIFTSTFNQLENEIQINPKSETVRGLIEFYLTDILKNYQSDNKLYVALCCTHYGYSEDIFKESLETLVKNYEIINPNKIMSQILTNDRCYRRFSITSIKVQIVSGVLISDEERLSIANVLNNISPITANALINYTYDKTLFK